MKKGYIFIILSIVLLGSFSFIKVDKNTQREVLYNGNNLLVSIDGSSSSSLPTTGTYYLTSYDCDNTNTKINWNPTTYELVVSNGNNGGGVSCDLEFNSKPLLSSMPVGSYVDYTGIGGTVGSTSVACQTNGSASSSIAEDETESPNSCSGQNAREDLDESGYTYGYCGEATSKYYTTGWRLAYVDSNSKPVIVSAGSPECNTISISTDSPEIKIATYDTTTSSTENVTYVQIANSLALKYCNINLVDNDCTCTDTNADELCDSPSSDVWAINDTDFYYMTKAISGVGKRLTEESSSLGDSGGTLGTTLYCYGKRSYQECGYNNDLIDNGGYYLFALMDADDYSYSVISWNSNRYVYLDTVVAGGLRPVISLSSSVYVTGGSGTMDDPYTIAKE